MGEMEYGQMNVSDPVKRLLMKIWIARNGLSDYLYFGGSGITLVACPDEDISLEELQDYIDDMLSDLEAGYFSDELWTEFCNSEIGMTADEDELEDLFIDFLIEKLREEESKMRN